MPDSVTPTLFRQLQSSAGNQAVVGLARRTRPSGQSASAAPRASGPDTAAAIAELHAVVEAERVRISTGVRERKQTLQATAGQTKQQVQASVDTAAVALTASYAQTIAQVQHAMQNARAMVTADKEAKVQATVATAAAQMAALEKTIADRQSGMRQAGENKARSAEQLGEMESQRALNGSEQRSNQALVLASQRIQKYRGYQRAADIGEAIRGMGSDAADQLKQGGADLAQTARKDATDLAAKFRKDASEAASGFQSKQGAARQKIEQERDQTTAGLTQMAEQSLTQLEASGRGLIAQHQQAQQGAIGQIRALAPAANGAIESSTATALARVEQAAARTTAELTRVEHQICTGLTRAWPWSARPFLQTAKAQAAAVGEGFHGGLDRLTGQLRSSIVQAGTRVSSRADAHVNLLATPVRNSGAQFETHAAQVSTDAREKLESTATQSAANMRATVGELDRQLQAAITQSEGTWQHQLQDGIAAISKKVNDGLSQQDKVLTELGSKIDQKAEEIEHQSLWDRATSFLGGFISGFFKGLWSIVKGILIIALVVLAVVLVAALLIVVFGGLELLLAVVLAVALFVAVNAALIGTILTIVGAIAAVVVLAVAAYHVYQALTRSDLTDWQRGELMGGAAADVGSVVVPEALLGRLGQTANAARSIEGAEDAAQLARLRLIVHDDAELERLVRLAGGDGAKLERMLLETGRDPARLERLLTATHGDQPMLQRLLGEVGGDGRRLDEVLTANGGDVGKAEAFLKKTPSELLRDIMGPNKFEEYQRTIDALKAEHPELANIPDEQLIAIRGYTSDDYAMLNKALRQHDAKELERLKPYIEGATSGLKQLPSYKGQVLRGENGTIANYLGKEGQVVTFDAFTSADRVNAFQGDVQLVIDSKTGKAVDMISTYQGVETEVLFAPGSQFKILEVTETSPGKFRVHLEDLGGG